MMLTPKVSVILPCYNMELFLSESLDSVLSQTLSEIEVICVNDGSTDSTLNILQAYQQKDPRITIINQENQGVAAARNVAIRSATGEYIAFMDPDDFYPDAHTLELLYTKASGNNALICGGSFSSYNNTLKKVSTYYPGLNAKYLFSQEGFVDYRDYQFDFGYHRFLYKREFLLKKQLFFPPYARFQDPPFFVRAMIEAGTFYAIPDVVYRYRCCFQEKSTSWPSSKLHDMILGYLDNLNLSAEYHLAELHALTVKRFEASYTAEPILNSIRSGNKETLALLIKVNQAICPALLKEAGMGINEDAPFLLQEFDLLLSVPSDPAVVKLKAEITAKKQQLVRLKRELVTLKSSTSFRIGRMVTYIPRKLRSCILCCKQHGIRHTVIRIYSHIFRRKT